MGVRESDDFLKYRVSRSIPNVILTVHPRISCTFCWQILFELDLFTLWDARSNQRVDVWHVDLIGWFGKYFDHWFVPPIGNK